MTDTISARLREDVFYGEERMIKFGKHNPLHMEAADHIDAQAARIASLEAAIKRQAGAAKTLRHLTLSEVQHLQDKDRTEYVAGKTLESERAANAMLTDELDAQAATIKALVEALGKLERICKNGQPDKISDGVKIASDAIALSNIPRPP